MLPCQALGVRGSVLGLVGPVSVYCDWVRWKVWSATSISVWRHVKLRRSVPEIHLHVAGTLSSQQTTTLLFVFVSSLPRWPSGWGVRLECGPLGIQILTESYQWQKWCTLVTTPPDVWRYRVSSRTGWPNLSILWLGEPASFISRCYLGLAEGHTVWADLSWGRLGQMLSCSPNMRQATKRASLSGRQERRQEFWSGVFLSGLSIQSFSARIIVPVSFC